MVAKLVRQIPIIGEHGQAIGYVCVLWAEMEVNLDRLLETVAPFEPAHISDSITANVDLHEKLRAL